MKASRSSSRRRCKEFFIDRVAILIGKAGEPCIAGKQCRQHNGLDVRSRKTGNLRSAGDNRYFELVRRKRDGNAAGPGEMADPKKMLDVEEDARRAHAFCHSLSNRRVSWRMLEL